MWVRLNTTGHEDMLSLEKRLGHILVDQTQRLKLLYIESNWVV